MRSCLALLVLLAAASPVGAQDNPNPIRRADPDFLFERPHGSVTLRGTWLFSRGGSDWFDFVTNHLTLNQKDFNAPGFGLDVSVPVTPRIDVQFAFDISRSSTLSEYRDFVDNNRLPIEQTTTLREVNLGANVRVNLAERARGLSRLAWVPRKVVPYVGGGGGVMNYNLLQSGDFVDFVDFSVFPDSLESHGWAPSAQVFGGADVHIFKRMYVTVDGRYLWSSADLGTDWIGFEPIDLAGFRLSGGVNFIF
jgi:hypothetical protein